MADDPRDLREDENGGVTLTEGLDGSTAILKVKVDPAKLATITALATDQKVFVSEDDVTKLITLAHLLEAQGLPYIARVTLLWSGTIAEVTGSANVGITQGVIRAVAGKTCRIIAARVIKCGVLAGTSGNTVFRIGNKPWANRGDGGFLSETLSIAWDLGISAVQGMDLAIPSDGYGWIEIIGGGHGDVVVEFDIEVSAGA